jgi:hypothetical protein
MGFYNLLDSRWSCSSLLGCKSFIFGALYRHTKNSADGFNFYFGVNMGYFKQEVKGRRFYLGYARHYCTYCRYSLIVGTVTYECLVHWYHISLTLWGGYLRDATTSRKSRRLSENALISSVCPG